MNAIVSAMSNESLLLEHEQEAMRSERALLDREYRERSAVLSDKETQQEDRLKAIRAELSRRMVVAWEHRS